MTRRTGLVWASVAVAVTLILSLIVLTPRSARADDPFKILLLGDSILAVGGASGDAARAELDQDLTAAGIDHVIETEAIGGHTCANWVGNAQAVAAAHHARVTVIDCGTNDSVSGTPVGSFDSTYLNLETNLLIGNPTGILLPSYIQYATRSDLPPAQALFNDAIYRVTEPHGGVHGTRIIYPIADLQQIPPIYVDAGKVHPTAAGGKAMGIIWFRAMATWYGWSPIPPLPCGMNGHRPGVSDPPYQPCNVLAGT